MKPEQIFIGNIKKCTKYEQYIKLSDGLLTGYDVGCTCYEYIEKEDTIYKENAVLIKIKNGGYVDLEKLNSVFDFIKIHKDITKSGYKIGRLMMSTEAKWYGCLFVDKESLKPYYSDKKIKNISLRKLKKQVKNDK